MRKRVLDVRFHGDDPARESVMTASFLQAGLFTSVVAFGVAAMAFVLGLVLALIGPVMMQVSRE